MIEPPNNLPQLETITVYTLLGVRFWDLVADHLVRDGLLVRAWPEDAPEHVCKAKPTAASVYAFHALPGLELLARPADGAAPWEEPPRPFTIEVRDQEHRYLPLVFTVNAPFRGVFPVDAPSSPLYRSPSGAYLFSAPTRSRQAGWATVRATLLDGDIPAGHAVLEVSLEGQRHYGVADRRGNVVVFFPYPNFMDPQTIASPGEAIQQAWSASLRVRYEPDALYRPPGTITPTIRSIFDQQNGSIWQTDLGPDVSHIKFQLVYREEAVLFTAGQSSLWLSPAASSP